MNKVLEPCQYQTAMQQSGVQLFIPKIGTSVWWSITSCISLPRT